MILMVLADQLEIFFYSLSNDPVNNLPKFFQWVILGITMQQVCGFQVTFILSSLG